MKRRQVVYAPEAVEDLRVLHAYALNTWDKSVADGHLKWLKLICDQLALFPDLGRAVGRWRRIGHERHVIYYVVTIDTVDILAVLHKKQLPSKHL